MRRHCRGRLGGHFLLTLYHRRGLGFQGVYFSHFYRCRLLRRRRCALLCRPLHRDLPLGRGTVRHTCLRRLPKVRAGRCLQHRLHALFLFAEEVDLGAAAACRRVRASHLVRCGGAAKGRFLYTVTGLNSSLDPIIHQVKHRLFVDKAHLDLGRVHIHIHQRRVDGHIQHAGGKAPHHNAVFIRLLQRRQGGLRLHQATVYEKILHGSAFAGGMGAGHIALQLHTVIAVMHRDQRLGQFPAKHGVHRTL